MHHRVSISIIRTRLPSNGNQAVTSALTQNPSEKGAKPVDETSK